MRVFYFAITILFISISSCAQAENPFPQEELAGIYEENFAGANPGDFIIVEGSRLSSVEVAVIEYAKSQYPDLAQYYAPLKDNEETMQIVGNAPSNKIIVLIGGPSQNKISKEVLSLGWIKEESKATYYAQLVVQNGTNPNGAKIFILSDNKGYNNLPRKSVEYSPLSKVIPPEYVPPAATGISAILLHLFNLGQTMVEETLEEFGKKKKKKGRKKEDVIKKYAKEILSFILASLVLAIGITWTFVGSNWVFIPYLILNIGICFFLIMSYDGFRWAAAKVLKIPAEYTFWSAGAMITLVSSFLGNPFGLSGVLIEETEKVKEKWKVGVMNLSASLLSVFIALAFFIINFIFPWEVFQMIFSASSTIAMVSMLPLGSLGGNEIMKWKFFVWLFGFIFVAAVYAAITFLIV
ncbi:MAG: hypothetical protein ACPL06_03250 [Candidatus Anstonellales archaeon]